MPAQSPEAYDILSGTPDTMPTCVSLAEQYPFKPYSYHHLPDECATAYHLHCVKDACMAADGKHAVWACKDGRSVGLLAWEFLEWDTTHLGLPCYRINHLIVEPATYRERRAIAGQLLQHVLADAVPSERGFLSAKVPSEDVAVIHALEQNGFSTIGTELTLKLPPDFERLPAPSPVSQNPADTAYHIRVLFREVPDGLPTLYNLQTHDRFHRDPRFSQEACDRLWNASLSNACAGYADQHVVMAFDHQGPAAVVTVMCDASITPFLGRPIASFFVVAVAPAHQGKGLGTRVMRHAIRWSLSQTRHIEVETQSDNYGALALYQKAGFRICFSKTIFHAWGKQ